MNILTPHPPTLDWLLWKRKLRFLEVGSKLQSPLGHWDFLSHQQWHLFLQPITNLLYHFVPTGCQLIWPFTWLSAHRTQRSHQDWYDLSSSTPVLAPPPSSFIPVSPLLEQTYHDQLRRISQGLPLSSTTPQTPKSIHVLPDGSPHPYYKALLQCTTPPPTTLLELLRTDTHHICADGTN